MNKHLYTISIGRMLQMIILFATYRVLSSVLSVSDMGGYYFLLSITGVFGLIFANPIGMYTNRKLHDWKNSGRLLINLKAIFLIFFVGSLLTAPILFMFKNKIDSESVQLYVAIIALIAYVFSTSINGTFVSSLNILGFDNQFVVLTILTNLFGLLLSYLFVLFVSAQPIYWLIGQAISFILFGVISLFFLRSKFASTQNVETLKLSSRFKGGIVFGIPIVITNIAMWSLSQSFRFFYKDNVDPIVFGELAFGLGLATSISVAVEGLVA